jgi:hypothetical protein
LPNCACTWLLKSDSCKRMIAAIIDVWVTNRFILLLNAYYYMIIYDGLRYTEYCYIFLLQWVGKGKNENYGKMQPTRSVLLAALANHGLGSGGCIIRQQGWSLSVSAFG